MARPSWYPVREVIHSATRDWAEAQCQAAEQAMATALIAEVERRLLVRVFEGSGAWHWAISHEAFESFKREAVGDEGR